MVERPQPPTSGSNGVAVSGGGRRRTLLWVALGTALLLLILAGLVTLAPTHAARWIVDRYFTGLPADVSGVTTLDVDLLRGEITFGPVTFHAGEAAPGRVGRLGLDLSVRKLFQRQVLVRSLILEDIDLRITQSAEGAFAVNGVPLRSWLRSESGPAAGAWSFGVWGAGVRLAQPAPRASGFAHRLWRRGVVHHR